jgi:hypothetical protein
MKTGHVKLVLLLVSLAGLAALVSHQANHAPPAESKSAAATNVPVQSVGLITDTVASASPKLGSPKAESQSTGFIPARTSLLAEFQSTMNGRQFVLDAWKHPESGGQFYASKLIAVCALLIKTTDGLDIPQPNTSVVGNDAYLKALKAQDLLRSKCGQFTDDELKQYSSVDQTNDAAMREVKALSDAIGNRDMEARRSAVQTILNSKDPLVLQDIGARMSAFSADGANFFYFDGQRYPLSGSPMVTAYYLIPCGLGLKCDAADPELMISCLSGAGCFDDRFARAKAQFSKGDEETFSKAVTLYRSMIEAISKGQVEKFFPQ